MYKWFRVKNFRCFRDLQINDLGRVNLIAGKNNTGKTALMEAMYILAGNREPKTLLRMKLRTLLRLPPGGELRDPAIFADDIISWRSMFRDFETKNEIALECSLVRPLLPLFPDTSTLSLKMISDPRLISDYEDVVYRFGIEDVELLEHSDLLEFVHEHDKVRVHLLLLGSSVLGMRGRTPSTLAAEFLSAWDKPSARNNARRFSDLRLRSRTEMLYETLAAIDPRVQGLELLYDGYRSVIYADLRDSGLQPLPDLGEGIQWVTTIALALTDENTAILFIDEIENGIHHTAQRKVWQAIGKLARELDIQVFATTHSLEMIRAAYEAFKDDDPYEFRYHRLDRKPDGDIEAVTYNKFGMDAVAAFDFQYEVRG